MEHFRIFDDTIVYLLLVAKELMRKCRFSCNLTNNCITKLLVYLLYIYFKLHDFAVNINLNTNLWIVMWFCGKSNFITNSWLLWSNWCNLVITIYFTSCLYAYSNLTTTYLKCGTYKVYSGYYTAICSTYVVVEVNLWYFFMGMDSVYTRL